MDGYLADLVMGGEAEMNDEEPEEEPEEEEDDEEPDEESPLKRPAAANGNPLKRPAAKKSEPAAKKPATSVAKKPAAKQVRFADEEEEEVQDDECDPLRDRMKSRKFNLLFNSLPVFIQKEFNEAQSDKSGSGRKRQTQIINKTINRSADGSLQVANVANMSFFREMLQRRKTKYQKKFKQGPDTHIPTPGFLLNVYGQSC